MSNYILTPSGEPYHYGIKGMKWGVRRYQNKDGSLTPAGKRHVYKTLKKYSNAKDRRAMLGDAVGRDELITNAARKAVSALEKEREAASRRVKLEREMEAAEYKEADRLYRNPNSKELVDKFIRDKYGRQYDVLREEESRARSEYKNTLKNIADEYLGKYGDRPVRKNSETTAAKALEIQIDWGLNLGRLKDD